MAQGDVQDVLIWGPDGKWTSLEGPEGPAGKKATVDVGTTTTSAPGGDAAVINSGTNQDAVFNFTIPRGEQGTKGDASTQQVGTVTTNQLNPGSDASVVINNSGTSTNATWDYTFSLAPGEKGEPGTGIQIKGQLQIDGEPVDGPPSAENTQHIGDWADDGGGDSYLDSSGDLWVWESQFLYSNVGSIQGPQGNDGNAATVSATASATTVDCQESADVVVINNGSANAAQFVFTFDIPRGCDGEKGEDGKAGDNAEVYAQANQPTAKAVGALWIQTAP